MGSRDIHEKRSGDKPTRLLKLYLSCLLLVVGVLAIYRSTGRTDGLFLFGAALTGGSTVSLTAQLWTIF